MTYNSKGDILSLGYEYHDDFCLKGFSDDCFKKMGFRGMMQTEETWHGYSGILALSPKSLLWDAMAKTNVFAKVISLRLAPKGYESDILNTFISFGGMNSDYIKDAGTLTEYIPCKPDTWMFHTGYV